MGKVYAKAIDLQEYGVIADITTSTPYIAISYTLYEDIDLDNGTWVNKNLYQYWFALNSFTYNYVSDTNTGNFKSLTFSGGNVQLQFSEGEIVDLNGNVIKIQDFFAPVSSALGLV